MKRTMPISLLVAEAAIALLVAHTIIMLGLDIKYVVSSGQSRIPQAEIRTAIRILHLSWSVIALIGLPFRWRIAWYVARAASIIIGILETFGGVFVLFVFLLSEKHDPLFFRVAFWNCFFALYLFMIYYLLSRSATRSYFFDSVDSDSVCQSGCAAKKVCRA